MTRQQALSELNLNDPCTPDEIRQAYKKRSLATHPDRGGSNAAFKQTSEAYNLLIGRSTHTATNTANTAQANAASREDWLMNACSLMSKHAELAGIALPTLRISVGYGTAGRRKQWCTVPGKHTQDGTPQIFVTPEVSKTSEILNLVAEAAAETIRLDSGQDNADAWAAVWSMARNTVINESAPYPHSAVNAGKKKEGTRLLKATCTDCGYVIRVTHKWAETCLPTCGQCGTEFELE